MVKPRIFSAPKARASTLGKEAVELARSAGLVLDEWQAFVLDHALRKNGSSWASFEVGLNCPRQNGKGAILEARELAGLYLVREKLVIHSAHEFATSLEGFRRLLTLIEETPDLDKEVKRVSRAHGEEGIELKGGRRIRFRTRTRGGGRGFTCDCLILDEAMFLPEFAHGALVPTVSARPNPQVWYAGSAVDQAIHEHGIVFARVRERGMKGDDPALAYFEWSVEGENPGTVADNVATDEAAWAQANPALGIRITPEHLGYEQRSMDARTFAVERLGIGDWPRTDYVSESPIDLDTWLSLTDQGSELQDPICLAFDVSPDRRSSISAAGRNNDGLWHIEVVEDRAGTGWVAERISQRLAELSSSHRPKAVVCDGYGPAASLIPAIEALGVEVTTVTAGEHAAACGRFVDLVEEKAIRHLGSSELTGAIRSARTRPLGDAWAWSRKNSTTNISPLVSVTLALSAALTAKPVLEGPLFAWA
jgi:hypothetical protein